MSYHAALLILSWTVAVGDGPDDFRGAAAVLQQAETRLRAPAGDEQDQPKSPLEQLREDIEALAAGAGDLPVDAAVAGWLELVDRLNTDPGLRGSPYSSPAQASGLKLVITAIPGPETWHALVAAIEARPLGEGQNLLREQCLRLLAHLLAGDEAAQWKDLAGIERQFASLEDYAAQQFAFRLQQLSDNLSSIADGPGRSVATFDRKVRRIEQTRSRDEMISMQFFGLKAPDLVAIVGRKEAEALLRRAIVQPVMIEVARGPETQQLAHEVAIDLRIRCGSGVKTLAGGGAGRPATTRAASDLRKHPRARCRLSLFTDAGRFFERRPLGKPRP